MEKEMQKEVEEFLSRQELRLAISNLADEMDNAADTLEDKELRDLATRGYALARLLREETA